MLHPHLIHLRCTRTSFIFAAPAPHSSSLHPHLIHLRCTRTSFIFAAPAPHSSLLHPHLIHLRCTRTSFIFAAPAPHSSLLHSFSARRAPRMSAAKMNEYSDSIKTRRKRLQPKYVENKSIIKANR